MRKIIYSEYVNIEGTNNYKLEEKGEALFHQWGRDTHSDEDGSFSTAIIELEDGAVKNIPADQIRFVSGSIVNNWNTVKVDGDIIQRTLEFEKTPKEIKNGITVYPSIAECLEFKQRLIDEEAKGA